MCGLFPHPNGAQLHGKNQPRRLTRADGESGKPLSRLSRDHVSAVEIIMYRVPVLTVCVCVCECVLSFLLFLYILKHVDL